MTIEIHIDGACKNNNIKDAESKPTHVCVLIPVQEHIDEEILYFKQIKDATNNFAEWMALLRALIIIKSSGLSGLDDIIIYSDSQLIVNQYNDNWKIKKLDLKFVYDEAKALNVNTKVVWLGREENLAGKYLEKYT